MNYPSKVDYVYQRIGKLEFFKVIKLACAVIIAQLPLKDIEDCLDEIEGVDD